MAKSMDGQAHRMPPKSLRTYLASVHARGRNLRIDSGAVRGDSDPLRTDPIGDVKAEALDLIEQARMRVGLSRKAMALKAGCPESALSEALNSQRGNFAAQWLMAQDDDFLIEFVSLVQSRRGLSQESERLIKAQRIGELVRLLVEAV